MMRRSALLLSLSFTAANANNRPVIGIWGQPHSGDECPSTNCQYIAASYVKFVESHGGRAVPISYYATDDDIDMLFGNLSGILFPGGGAAVPDGAYRMYANAKAANAQGDYFPVWGTCMGFQWLVQLEGASLDGGFDSENVSLPLEMASSGVASDSRLFSGLDPALFAMLQDPTNTSAFNNHGYGITPDHFVAVEALNATYEILSTSEDRNGKPFVSTMEARDPALPFYGVQWHPEKNVWELGEASDGSPYEAIPHTPDAVAATLYLAEFLIAEARKSAHVYSQEAESAFPFIWSYPIFDTSPEFMQSFIADF